MHLADIHLARGEARDTAMGSMGMSNSPPTVINNMSMKNGSKSPKQSKGYSPKPSTNY